MCNCCRSSVSPDPGLSDIMVWCCPLPEVGHFSCLAAHENHYGKIVVNTKYPYGRLSSWLPIGWELSSGCKVTKKFDLVWTRKVPAVKVNTNHFKWKMVQDVFFTKSLISHGWYWLQVKRAFRLKKIVLFNINPIDASTLCIPRFLQIKFLFVAL